MFLSEVSSEKTEGTEAYDEAHIPGAYHINADTVQYNDPEQLGEFLKTNGITKDTKVILYGKNATDSSVAKVAFTMLYAGVEDVKIVDGGMDAWKTAGFATETGENLPKAGTDDYSFGTKIPVHPEYILSGEDVKEKLKNDADFRLVSIRSEAEFRGEGDASVENAGEPLGAVWGHDTADGSYTEKDTEMDAEIKKTAGSDKVKAILAESDSTLNDNLSFYSNGEGKETIPFLICYQNNVKNISIYAGGWKEWQSNYQEDPENWPMQKVTPEETKTYGILSLAKKEISTDSEGHKLMAQEASVAENPLTCWPERIRKHITYTYGSELSNSIVNVDPTGKVITTGFGDAVIAAKTETSNKVSYTIHVQKGEDYFYSSTSWDSMYLDADTVISAVKAGDLNVLDIRFAQQELNGVEAGYAAGHIKGSIWAPAWPTKTASAQANVRKEAERIKNSENPTVIVCMAGAEGAKRAAAVLMDAGVAKSKLRILTGGGKNLVMNYKDQLVTGIKE